jgi:hypothetical protein
MSGFLGSLKELRVYYLLFRGTSSLFGLIKDSMIFVYDWLFEICSLEKLRLELDFSLAESSRKLQRSGFLSLEILIDN